MRILLAIVVLLGLGWSGYWYLNATARDRALTGWLDERRAAGWVAEGAVRVTGFPNRVDTIVTGLDLADPSAGWAWRAPEFQILSLSYKPHHVIAVWPGKQTVATPYETVRIASDQLRGSQVFEPNRRLGLDHATLQIENMSLAGETGWTAAIGEALFSTRKAAGDAPPFSYDVDFTAQGLRPPDALIAAIDRAGVLPPAIETTHLATTLVFDRAWDRDAIESENPALREIRVANARVSWGELDLRAKGTLGVDAAGFAAGRIDLTARNWRDMLDAAEQSRLISPTAADALRVALTLYAGLSGSGDTIDLPLEFKDGTARLGPIAIGPAPLLSRRT